MHRGPETALILRDGTFQVPVQAVGAGDAALRAYYLNRRQAEIDALRGRKTTPLLPDPLAAPREDKPNIAPATDAQKDEIGQQEPRPAEKGNEAQPQPQS